MLPTGCPYHPELGGDQVGIFHSSVKSQKAIGAPAEQHSFKRSVGIELQREWVGGGAEQWG